MEAASTPSWSGITKDFKCSDPIKYYSLLWVMQNPTDVCYSIQLDLYYLVVQ